MLKAALVHEPEAVVLERAVVQGVELELELLELADEGVVEPALEAFFEV